MLVSEEVIDLLELDVSLLIHLTKLGFLLLQQGNFLELLIVSTCPLNLLPNLGIHLLAQNVILVV